MHLSRGYPWKLDISDRELSVIEKCLRNDSLTDDDDELASHLLDTIVRERNKALNRKKSDKAITAAQLNAVDDESEDN